MCGKSVILAELAFFDQWVVSGVMFMPGVGRVFFPEVGKPHFGGCDNGQANAEDGGDHQSKNPLKRMTWL
jgi:hypothetical protein